MGAHVMAVRTVGFITQFPINKPSQSSFLWAKGEGIDKLVAALNPWEGERR